MLWYGRVPVKECRWLVGERLIVRRRALHIKGDGNVLYATAACLTICAVIVKKASNYFDGPFHGFRANDLQSIKLCFYYY